MKAFFVSGEGVVPYNPGKHFRRLRNFLYWKDGEEGLLVAGDGSYYPGESGHKSLLHCFRQRQHGYSSTPSTTPDGAGNGGADELTWTSTGFDMETPENLRPEIEKALKP